MIARFGRPALLLGLAYLSALYLFQIGARAHRHDFADYYTWALAAREGINPYTPSVMAFAKQLGAEAMLANYPPFFLLIFEPLTYLSLETAFQIWFGLNIILLLAASVVMTARIRPLGIRLFFVAMVLLYGPTTDNLYWGQLQILLLFLIVVVLKAERRGWNWVSATALAAAILIKLFPAVILGYFAETRRWLFVCGTLIGVFIGSVLGLYTLGPVLNLAFVHQLLAMAGERFFPYALNISIGAVIYRVFWLAGLNGGASDYAIVVITSLAMLGIFALCASGSMAANRRGDSDKAFGLWVTASVLTTPISWFHHMVLLVIPLIDITEKAAIACTSFKMAAASYGFAEVALILLWSRWATWPHYDLPIQIAIEASAFISMLFCLAASYDFARRGVRNRDTVLTSPPSVSRKSSDGPS
jgi:alpha-1,2-mannosyltransferase